jgi:hypothetical protein
MSGTKNKIEDLRNHLFATLEDLRDDSKPLEQSIARAKAVAEVAGKVIETAKVEVDFLKVTGGSIGTGFIPDERPEVGPGAARPQLTVGRGRR